MASKKSKSKTKTNDNVKQVKSISDPKVYVEISPTCLSIKFPSSKKIDHIVDLQVL